MTYAEVAVGAPAQPGKTFSYSVPEGMEVRPGHAVQVPFGPRQLPGFVFALAQVPGYPETRPITRVVGEEPWLSPQQLSLARWISETYRSPLYSAAVPMVPPGFRQKVQAVYVPLQQPSPILLEGLDERQRTVLDYLTRQGTAGQGELQSRFRKREADIALGQLTRKGLVKRTWVWRRPTVQPKLVRTARLAVPRERALEALQAAARPLPERQRQVLGAVLEAGDEGLPTAELSQRFGAPDAALAALARSGLVVREHRRLVRLAASREAASEALAVTAQPLPPKQREVLDAIIEAGEPGVRVASLPPGAGPALAALAERGLVAIERERVERDPLAGRSYAVTRPLDLTARQARCWDAIAGAMDASAAGPKGEPPVFLLFGVTGSGKTELYLRAIARAVAQGKRGIVLVPEIALTPQTIERFAGRFPGRVAVLHSRLSAGEQFDEWWRIREGRCDVVIGPRSALFAPLPDVGIIVLDEEHEWTYKQEEAQPFYHARDVAIRLGELTGAPVILGSATPALESFHRARSGRYKLLELPERIIESNGSVTVTSRLPAVEVVDLREELKAGNRSIFSRALKLAIDAALDAREQVILFLNRRGSATFVQCRDCGHVARCRRCTTTLTYHSDQVALRCHQCNYQTQPPRRCPECWGQRIRYLGLGTQRLEVETAQNFPRAGILRWDRDVTQGRDAHEAILRQFVEHKADILIGTQMLAKGLHLPRVTLVGVINADIGLYAPDFRAPERVFQVLCQVAGRSGRGAAGGRVIVQSYAPESYAIAAAATQDYASFYDQEIVRRAQAGMPPFSRLARLVYRHSSALAARRECERVHHLLQEELAATGFPNTRVIGPAPAPLERLRGRYRWHLVVQSPDPGQLLDRVTLPTGWTVDVDPVHMQ